MITVQQLRDWLGKFPQDLPVVAEDGSDPSDLCYVNEIILRDVEKFNGVNFPIERVLQIVGWGDNVARTSIDAEEYYEYDDSPTNHPS